MSAAWHESFIAITPISLLFILDLENKGKGRKATQFLNVLELEKKRGSQRGRESLKDIKDIKAKISGMSSGCGGNGIGESVQ